MFERYRRQRLDPFNLETETLLAEVVATYAGLTLDAAHVRDTYTIVQHDFAVDSNRW